MLRNTNCQLFCICYSHITFNYDFYYVILVPQLDITELSHVYHLYSYCASSVIALVLASWLSSAVLLLLSTIMTHTVLMVSALCLLLIFTHQSSGNKTLKFMFLYNFNTV